MNHHVRLRKCTYALLRMWCSASTPVFCVSGCVWFCVWCAALGAARGDIQRVATPDLHLPTPRAPVQKRSRTVRPILFAFLGSRRQWVVNPRSRVSAFFLSPRSGDSTPVQVVRGTSAVAKQAARRSPIFKKVHPSRLHLPLLIFRKMS